MGIMDYGLWIEGKERKGKKYPGWDERVEDERMRIAGRRRRTHTHTRAHTRAHTRTHTNTHRRKFTCAGAKPRTHMHAHTHTLTGAHTHIPSHLIKSGEKCLSLPTSC